MRDVGLTIQVQFALPVVSQARLLHLPVMLLSYLGRIGTGEPLVRVSLARTLCEIFHLNDPHEELRDLFAEKIPRQS